MPEVVFGAPPALWLLGVALLVGLLDAWKARGTPRRMGAAVRGLGLAALAAALSQPVARWPGAALPTVHVLDASDSIRTGALQERVASLEDAGDPVVVAGTGVAVWRPGTPLSETVASVRGPGGRLEEAVAVAAALGGPVVLHSDGGEPLAALPEGVALSAVPLVGRPAD